VLLAAARQAGTFENVLRGRAVAAREGGARVALAPGLELAVAGLHESSGADVLIALRAEDILVATGDLPAISARNVIPAVVADVRVEGEDAWVEARMANAMHVTVLLTPSAIRDLALATGSAVRLVVKAQSCRVLASS
jgi:molybdopterin-binding protein